MAVIAQLPKEKGGAEGRVAVIDTEGTWRPDRIKQISERFGSAFFVLPGRPYRILTARSRSRGRQREHSLRSCGEQRRPTRSALWSRRAILIRAIPSSHHRQHHDTLPQRLPWSWRAE